jgi:hypothetical protein
MLVACHLINMCDTFRKVAHSNSFVLDHEASIELIIPYNFFDPSQWMICEKFMASM